MKFRSYLAIVLVSSLAACSNGSDSATGPLDLQPSNALLDDGVKPPPPAGSDDVDIDIFISADGGESVDAAARAGAFEADESFAGFFGRPKGRYFANTQDTNGWLDFETGNGIIATPGARLSYNEKQERGRGQGTLTLTYAPYSVLDLSKLVVLAADFGACTPLEGEGGGCAYLVVEYLGNVGSISVKLANPETGPG